MELRLEVEFTIYCTVVLTLALLIPFNPEPDSVTSLWIIPQFTNVADRAKFTLELDSLADQIFVYWLLLFCFFYHLFN